MGARYSRHAWCFRKEPRSVYFGYAREIYSVHAKLPVSRIFSVTTILASEGRKGLQGPLYSRSRSPHIRLYDVEEQHFEVFEGTESLKSLLLTGR